MFDVTCPSLGQRVLIWPSHLLGVRNDSGVIELAFTCACGALAVLRTGASTREELVTHEQHIELARL